MALRSLIRRCTIRRRLRIRLLERLRSGAIVLGLLLNLVAPALPVPVAGVASAQSAGGSSSASSPGGATGSGGATNAGAGNGSGAASGAPAAGSGAEASSSIPPASAATATRTIQPTPTSTTPPTATATATAVPSATTTSTATLTPTSTSAPTTAATTAPASTAAATTGPSATVVQVDPKDEVPILVKFRASASARDVDDAIRGGGGRSMRHFGQTRTRVINVPAQARDAILRAYQRHSAVERADAAIKLNKADTGTPNDPAYAQQWALPKIAWNQAYGTVSISGAAKIAVLDTGVDAAHPDLAGRMVGGQSFVDGGDANTDPNGHGTSLAGIAAASVNNATGMAGVAYAGASISSVQVLGADGSGYDSDVIAGVLWAADNGAQVILMGFSSADYSSSLADALAYAWSKGAVLVAAAGNSGSTAATYPAGMPNVIGVAATDQNDALAASSNTGSATVAAPGESIYTTLPGGAYGAVSGTSASSAHAAGLAALLTASGKSNADASSQIRSAADPVPNQPFGRLNVTNALGVPVSAQPTPVLGPTPTPGGAPTYEADSHCGLFVRACSDRSISKSASPSPVTAGSNLTYTLTVFNNGPDPSTSLTITDTLPSGVSLVGLNAPGWSCSLSGLTLTCSISTVLNPGGFMTIFVTVFVPTSLAGTTITNTATVGGSPTDRNSSNNTATVNTFVAQPAKANTTTSVTSSANPSVYGQAVTFTATVSESAAGTPTGSVTFRDGGTVLGTVGLNGAAQAIFTTSALSVGSHSITATYNGDSAFNGSTSATMTQTVNKASTSTSLTSSVNPSTAGQSVTFTANVLVSSPGAGAPTGSVTFFDNGTVVASVALSASGQASFSTSSLTAGSHSIQASYNGDPNFHPSGGAVMQNVSRANTTTTVTTSTNPSVYGQPVTLIGSVTVVAPGAGAPAGTVTFRDGSTVLGTVPLSPTSGTSAAATLTTSSLVAGGHTITATYNGDSSFNTSTSAALSQTVNRASTTTTLTSSVNPSAAGQTVTFTASVRAMSPGSGTPTGSVTFYDNGTAVATSRVDPTGQASHSSSSLSVGTHSVTATYDGDPNFTGSVNTVTQVVNNTTPVVDTGPDASIPEGNVYSSGGSFADPDPQKWSATVDYGDGTGTQPLELSGTTFALSHGYTDNGTYTVTVSVTDSSGATGSDSAVVTVNNVAPTAAFSASGPIFAGGASTLSFSKESDPSTADTAAGFRYSFACDGQDASLAASYAAASASRSAACTFTAPGTYTVKGRIFDKDGGHTTYSATVVVESADTTTTVTASANPSVYGQSITVAAAVSAANPGAGTPKGSVTFKQGTTVLAGPLALDGTGRASFTTAALAAGSHIITAEYSGDATYNASAASLTQTVNRATLTVTANDTTRTYGTQNPPFTATYSGFQNAETLATSGVAGAPSLSTDAVQSSSAGTYVITAASGSLTAGNYAFAFVNGTLAITRAASTTTLSSSPNPSVLGQAITLVATVRNNGFGSPGGTVTYFDGTATLGAAAVDPLTGTASFATTALAAGTHSLSATYGGDANFTMSSSDAVAHRVNTPPAAANASYTVDEDAALVVPAPGVLAHVSDVEGEALTALLVEHVVNGQLALAQDGSFTYTPTANFNGEDRFTYQARDASGALSNVAAVTIRVQAVNDSPVASDDVATTLEDTAVDVDVIANDTDIDTPQTNLSVADGSISSVRGGTAQVLPGGRTVRFTPAADANSVNSTTGFGFNYQASDGAGRSAAATVNVTVRAVNDAPVPAGDDVTTREDTPLAFAASDLTRNDSPGPNESGQTLTVIAVSPASSAGGTVTLAGGSVTYTPPPNFNGTDHFSYTVRDDGVTVGAPDSKQTDGNVTVTVAPVNDTPIVTAAHPAVVVDEGQAATNSGSYADIDAGDSVTLSASVGTVTKTGVGSGTWSWSFASTDGPAQSQTVTISADDGNGGVAVTTFSLTVNNLAPTAVLGNTGPANEGSPVSVSFGGQADPSSADTAGGFRYAFACDGGSLDTATYASAGPNASTSCTFADGPTTHTVRGRIIDKDGGYSEYTTVVAVNNVAPTLSIHGAATVDEGAVYTLSLASTDPGADTISGWTINWGDGSSPQTVPGRTQLVTHVYADGPNAHTITATATDEDGTYNANSLNVSVTNVAPSATFSAPARVDEGSTFTISLTNTQDPGTLDTFTYAFDCGFGYGAPGTASSAVCPTTDNGTRTVRGTITDKDGASVEYGTVVTIFNVAPSAAIGGAPEMGPEGTGISLTSTVVDPGTADAHTYAWSVAKSGAPFASGSAASFSFTPDDNGSYVVTLSVTDDDGASGTDSKTIVITNVAPSVTPAANQTAHEGLYAAFALGSFADPGADSPWTVDVSWGDGSTTSSNASAPGSFGSAAHTYADDGTYTVTVKVTDKDGGIGQATFTVTVAGVAPSVSIDGAPRSSAEGASIALTSTVTDPSPADTAAGFALVWSVTKNGAAFGAPGGASSYTFTPDDNGTYVVTLRASDKDGLASQTSVTVDVANVPPSAAIVGAPASGPEGATISLTGTFGDPGSADTHIHSWTVAKNGVAGFASGAGAAFSFTPDDNGAYAVTFTVTDDDGGAGTDTRTIDVTNVNPTAVLSNSGPVDEGSPATIHFTNQSDPSAVDSAVGFTYAYSCAASTTSAATCAFADNGAYEVRGTIFDKDGGATTYLTVLTVNNVAPSVAAPADQSAAEGSATLFALGSFADPGADSPWLVDVDWGDGTTRDSFALGGPGPLGSLPHTYADNGTYAVTVRVQDKDRALGTATFRVTVANVAPIAILEAPARVSEGSPIRLALSGASDPSPADSAAGFTYAFDCGAGYGAFGGDATASCGTTDNGVRAIGATIRDKDGGATEYRAQVTIDNVAPALSPAAGQSTTEGAPTTFSLGAFIDPGADSPWTVSVSWGDGSTATAFAAADAGALAAQAHTYADNGTYTVTVTVADKDGASDTATFSVTVANVAPTVDAGADATIDEGGTFSGAGAFVDPGTDSWTATVDYGDGSGQQPLPLSGKAFSLSHTYADSGRYTVAITVTDDDGATGSDTLTVTVNNVTPVVTPAADQSAVEGMPGTFPVGSFSDPGADSPWSVGVDWGDGSPATVLSRTATGPLPTLPHTYADNGTYTVVVVVADKDGATGRATFAVTVSNVTPAVDVGGDATISEGGTFTGTGSFTDSGADSWTATVDYGDGSGVQPLALTGKGFGLGHTYADNGTYTITVAVSDDDGGSGSDTLTVTVLNVAPTASLGNSGPVDEGSPVTISFTGQLDPSPTDTSAGFRYAFACDGGPLDAATYASAGTSASTTCLFPDDSDHPVRARILDKDGGFTEYVTEVTVNNVTPTITPAADQSTTEGAATNIALGSFFDPGADSPWAVDVDWGDGTGRTTFSVPSVGSLGSQTHTYADNGAYTVTVRVTDIDGATGHATFSVTVANVSPAVDSGADATIDEGGAFAGSGSFADPGADSWSATVDYGDGSGVQPLALAGKGFALGHTYADSGLYTVAVRVADDDGATGTDTLTVTVNNVAPALAAPADQRATEGIPATFLLGSFADPGADSPWAVSVSWGDQSTPTTFTATSTGGLASQSHTYADNGTYAVTVTVADKDGAIGTTTFRIAVANADPTVDAGANAAISEAGTFSGAGTFADSGADTWTATVDYGDGSGVQPLALAGKAFGLSHRYADNGIYTVTVTVTDDDGGRGTDTLNVSVANVTPSVTPPAAQSANEGATTTFNLGSFGDPGPDAPWNVAVDWGDGTAPTTYSVATVGSLGSRDHTYADNGAYTITIRVTDKDGATGQTTFTATVANVAPTSGAITAPIDPVHVGTVITATVPFTDPGTVDTHTALWEWGDDTSSAGTVGERGGSGTATGSHAYRTPGVYTVRVTITDKDGATSQSVFQYVVVYDPDGGFVTGGGWITSPAGACRLTAACEGASGRATFGFNSKYQRGANVPTGQTQFQFKAGNLNFHSTEYEWLVVAGHKAQYKGEGTINGAGDYGFMLSAIDGQLNGGGGTDKFRIKIWDRATGGVVYDNQMGAADDAEPTTTIGAGSIVIHRG